MRDGLRFRRQWNFGHEGSATEFQTGECAIQSIWESEILLLLWQGRSRNPIRLRRRTHEEKFIHVRCERAKPAPRHNKTIYRRKRGFLLPDGTVSISGTATAASKQMRTCLISCIWSSPTTPLRAQKHRNAMRCPCYAPVSTSAGITNSTNPKASPKLSITI